MSERKLRQLERRWLETQAVEDEAAYLQARVRQGELSREALELLAFLDHPAAREALGADAPPGFRPPDVRRVGTDAADSPVEQALLRWLKELRRYAGPEISVRAAVGACRLLEPKWLARGHDDARPQAILAALDAYTEAPGRAALEAVQAAVPPAGWAGIAGKKREDCFPLAVHQASAWVHDPTPAAGAARGAREAARMVARIVKGENREVLVEHMLHWRFHGSNRHVETFAQIHQAVCAHVIPWVLAGHGVKAKRRAPAAKATAIPDVGALERFASKHPCEVYTLDGLGVARQVGQTPGAVPVAGLATWWVRPRSVKVLGAPEALAGVEQLDLRAVAVRDAHLAGLARLPQLRRLSLRGGKRLTDDGLQQLAAAPGLRELSLRNVTGIRGGSLARFTQLVELDLRGASLSRSGWQALGGLTGLEVLHLGGASAFGDDDLAFVAALTGLRVLSLADAAGVTDAGLAALAGLTALERLDLSGLPQVGDAGLEHLRALTALVELDLSRCRVRGPGLAALAGARGLKRLALVDAPLRSAPTLEHARALSGLTELDLRANHEICNDALWAEAAQAFPDRVTVKMGGVESETRWPGLKLERGSAAASRKARDARTKRRGDVIEPARSGRATCRTCKQRIEAGALRFGALASDPRMGYRWYHLECAETGRMRKRLEAARADGAGD